jgi:tripartite-type tricarboxylate transporter receptor subunit TctC
MTARTLLLAASVAFVALGARADYPDRPVRIVVPFAAGSGADVVARTTATALTKRTKAAFSVENRTAAGTAAVAKAAPDGYTLLVTGSAFTLAPHTSKSAGYDPLKDFVPVARIAVIPLVVVTGAKSRFKTLDDLVAAMRQAPGKVRYATSGKGTVSHFEVELVNHHFKVQAQDRAYASDADALAAVLAGEADFFLANYPMAERQINSGTLRALALGSSARLATRPDLPTLAEVMRRPGYEASAWYGMLAPRGLSVDAITRLEEEIELELEVREVREKIESVGGRPAFLRSAPFAGQLGYEYRKWALVTKAVQ